MKRWRCCVFFLQLFLMAVIARGSVIYSDFDPTNFTYYGGWPVYGTSSAEGAGAFNAEGMGFTPSSSAVLTNIDVAIFWESGTNSVILSLDSDNSGGPGAVLESWTLTGLPGFGFCCTAEIVTDTLGVQLTAGKQYWLTVLPGASDTLVGWTTINTINGPVAEEEGIGAPWVHGTSVPSAFEVDGTVVTPEPSSAFLAIAGIASLLAGRQGHQDTVRSSTRKPGGGTN